MINLRKNILKQLVEQVPIDARLPWKNNRKRFAIFFFMEIGTKNILRQITSR